MMKIGYCRNCTMESSSQRKICQRRRIIIRIIVDLTIWMAASVIAFYLFLFEKPYERGFFCDDKSLSYPSVPETISTPVMVVVGLTAALILIISVEVLNWLDLKCRKRYQHASSAIFCVKSYMVFMIGFLIQELFVDTLKNRIGVLRPNFFDVCKPQFNLTLCPGYITEYMCSGNDEKEIRSSRQSFPSGHSSFAMFIAVYFSLYIENRLHIRFSRLLKIFLQVSLVLAAILCGFGRIRENKHHLSDVLAGFILGITVAVFVHTMMWRKFVEDDSRKEGQENQEEKSRDCCCVCNQPSDIEFDSQTPSSISQNGYFQNIENGRNSSSAKLISIQNNNNQTISERSEIM
ncbi:phospholipid phosphatase 2-like [Ruditapes philippinarum]|uniref:phospholipid phosphatase 2-like n=1 Tax=Ruditapes philippinarum TaxID=129788 RepID=UPI00295AF74D|nr:phospholipid phosphatase 2-like [Ruditapes philippinarum]